MRRTCGNRDRLRLPLPNLPHSVTSFALLTWRNHTPRSSTAVARRLHLESALDDERPRSRSFATLALGPLGSALHPLSVTCSTLGDRCRLDGRARSGAGVEEVDGDRGLEVVSLRRSARTSRTGSSSGERSEEGLEKVGGSSST